MHWINENSTITFGTCIGIYRRFAITWCRIRARDERQLQRQTDFAESGGGLDTWASREGSMDCELSKRGSIDV